MNDYKELLTNINAFNTEWIDYENYSTKTIYNIYNNNVKIPCHNFWFIFTNCKFINIQENKNSKKLLRFSINGKYGENKKAVDCILTICDFVKNVVNQPDNIEMNYEKPWFSIDNMPQTMCFNYLDEDLIIYSDKNIDMTIKNIEDSKKNNTYTLLTELAYYRIQNNTIIFAFNLKMIQMEKIFNLKNCSLLKYNNITTPQHEHIKTEIISNENMTIRNENVSHQTNLKPSLSLNLNDLINRKSQLRKTVIVPEELQPKKTAGETFLEQKELLKKVNIEEKQELKIQEEIPTKIKKIKKIKKNKKVKKIESDGSENC